MELVDTLQIVAGRVCEIIRNYHDFKGGIKQSVPMITKWHHEACRVITSVDHEGWIFALVFTRIMDFFLAHH